jgi:hypothetical protein
MKDDNLGWPKFINDLSWKLNLDPKKSRIKINLCQIELEKKEKAVMLHDTLAERLSVDSDSLGIVSTITLPQTACSLSLGHKLRIVKKIHWQHQLHKIIHIICPYRKTAIK